MNHVPHIAKGIRSTGFDATECGLDEKAGSYTYRIDAFRALAAHTKVCGRCLASLAKRDREFRRKARLGLMFGFDRPECLLEPFCACGRVISRCDGSRRGCKAARAIAREEGRCL